MTYININLYLCSMKKSILLLPVIALACTACHKQTFDERVLAEVEQFNQKEAPKRLDMYTTFDSMNYDTKSLMISYFYTIEGNMDASVFPVDAMREELLGNLRNSIQLKAHKEHGISFHYIYFLQKTGKPLLDCTFTPEDYNSRVRH